MTPHVWAYLYGGLMIPEVMARLDFQPRALQPASLPGFKIDFAPLVNLTPDPKSMTYGILAETTHANLDAVYAQLQTRYLPYPVLALDAGGRSRPALCYLATSMPAGERDGANIQGIISTLAGLETPDWYLNHLRSFLP